MAQAWYWATGQSAASRYHLVTSELLPGTHQQRTACGRRIVQFDVYEGYGDEDGAPFSNACARCLERRRAARTAIAVRRRKRPSECDPSECECCLSPESERAPVPSEMAERDRRYFRATAREMRRDGEVTSSVHPEHGAVDLPLHAFVLRGIDGLGMDERREIIARLRAGAAWLRRYVDEIEGPEATT